MPILLVSERVHDNETINACPPCRQGQYYLLPSLIATQDPSATYQPSFNTLGADAFLSSLEGILYRLLLLVLRKITKFLASSSFTFKPNSNSIPIHVHDAVLEQLLRILSCLAITPWRIFDDLAGVLNPACV